MTRSHLARRPLVSTTGLLPGRTCGHSSHHLGELGRLAPHWSCGAPTAAASLAPLPRPPLRARLDRRTGDDAHPACRPASATPWPPSTRTGLPEWAQGEVRADCHVATA